MMSSSNDNNSEQQRTSDLVRLATTAVVSSISASRPIRKIAYANEENEGYQNSRRKFDGSIVTDADLKAQHAIVDAFRSFDENVRIVGEEDDTASVGSSSSLSTVPPAPEEGVPLGLSKSLFEFVFQDIKKKLILEDENVVVCSSRVSIFVDPLDGTSSYARGQYHSVTTLIGITLDHKPIFGVIGRPFGAIGDENSCGPIVYGGTLVNGVFELNVDNLSVSQIKGRSNTKPYDRKAVVSRSRTGELILNVVQELSKAGHLNQDPVPVSGAGEKALRLIVGEKNECLWPFPQPGTSIWDVAAPEALLRVFGGKLSDRYGHQIDYSENGTRENSKGVIAAASVDLHQACIDQVQHLLSK